MKKKLLLSLLIVISMFVVVGCNKDNIEDNPINKLNFNELLFSEPKGYTSTYFFGSDEDETKSYVYGSTGSIIMNFQEGKDYSDVENLLYSKHIEKEINGFTWKIIEDYNGKVDSILYYTRHNGDLYLIELNSFSQYQKYMEEFINSVSFE